MKKRSPGAQIAFAPSSFSTITRESVLLVVMYGSWVVSRHENPRKPMDTVKHLSHHLRITLLELSYFLVSEVTRSPSPNTATVMRF
jgi:hypothetical protein